MEPHFQVRAGSIFALGTRGDASAIPALEALLKSNDLSIEMAPMIKDQIEHLKNPSAKSNFRMDIDEEGGESGDMAASTGSGAKTPGDQRFAHLEELVKEMNERLKTIENRLPPATAKP